MYYIEGQTSERPPCSMSGWLQFPVVKLAVCRGVENQTCGSYHVKGTVSGKATYLSPHAHDHMSELKSEYFTTGFGLYFPIETLLEGCIVQYTASEGVYYLH